MEDETGRHSDYMQRGAAFPEPTDLTNEVEIPRTVADYAGSYSTIHKGTCRGEYVAVKILRSLGVTLHAMRRKVYRERVVWAALQHPNIVPLFGYTEENRLFGPFGALISPWYHAGDAAKFLKQAGSRLSLVDRTWMWHEVVKGVDYLHGCEPTIIHGDLKPGNVLIDNQGRPRICDFGLASIRMGENQTGTTTTSPYTGTVRYVAPELLAEDVSHPTTASDIWALSCIGLEFIFELAPYGHRQHTKNLVGVILDDMSSGIPPATQPKSLTELYDKIWKLVETGWQWDPDQRSTVHIIQLELSQLVFRVSSSHRIPESISTFTSVYIFDHNPDLQRRKEIALVSDRNSALLAKMDPHAEKTQDLHGIVALVQRDALPLNADYPYLVHLNGWLPPADPTKLVFDLKSAWTYLEKEPEFKQCDVRRLSFEFTQLARDYESVPVIGMDDFFDFVQSTLPWQAREHLEYKLDQWERGDGTVSIDRTS